jgi:hypothetical protein
LEVRDWQDAFLDNKIKNPASKPDSSAKKVEKSPKKSVICGKVKLSP